MIKKFKAVITGIRVGCAAVCLIGSTSVCLVGCASEEKYNEKVNTWIGHSVEELLMVWGEPEIIEKTKSGSEIYRYNDHIGRDSLSATDLPPKLDPLHEVADQPGKTGGGSGAQGSKGRVRAVPGALNSGKFSEDPCLTYFVLNAGTVNSVGFGGTGCKAK